ncbi:MAG: class I SAM-dependent methyltransferase [Aureliella sp.]
MDAPETFYPLRAMVCDECFLTQLSVSVPPDKIFREYAYFSSVSSTWVAHARNYAEQMVSKLKLSSGSRVVEVASNDGYLLQQFVELGSEVLGVEPAENVAAVAEGKGIRCVKQFFSLELARELVEREGPANLLVANNVLAHVPEINDFVRGLAKMLADDGVLTLEFPHLMQLMDKLQFDTIYHEHFSYLSLRVVVKLLAQAGLKIFDVDQLATHGGSLRVFACHNECVPPWDGSVNVQQVLDAEQAFGLNDLANYRAFGNRIEKTKRSIIQFLLSAADEGKKVAGYGAPGKGTTLLHACGIDSPLLQFTVDKNSYKQGHYMPGTNIEIRDPAAIFAAQPDYLFILPWNLSDEIMTQMAGIRQWGGKFVLPIPELTIL